jgi:manganese/zinc/iron transport system permease protein
VVWNEYELGPPSVLRMGFVFLTVIGAMSVFYKELLVTSFDPGLAQSLGMRVRLWHYGLMGALALVVVSAFESVGAILAVAMLIVPAMFAAELSEELPVRLILTVLHAAMSAVLGLHLSIWLNCSAAGAMVVAAALLFAAAWVASQVRRQFRSRIPESRGVGVPAAGASS